MQACSHRLIAFHAELGKRPVDPPGFCINQFMSEPMRYAQEEGGLARNEEAYDLVSGRYPMPRSNNGMLKLNYLRDRYFTEYCKGRIEDLPMHTLILRMCEWMRVNNYYPLEFACIMTPKDNVDALQDACNNDSYYRQATYTYPVSFSSGNDVNRHPDVAAHKKRSEMTADHFAKEPMWSTNSRYPTEFPSGTENNGIASVLVCAVGVRSTGVPLPQTVQQNDLPKVRETVEQIAGFLWTVMTAKEYRQSLFQGQVSCSEDKPRELFLLHPVIDRRISPLHLTDDTEILVELNSALVDDFEIRLGVHGVGSIYRNFSTDFMNQATSSRRKRIEKDFDEWEVDNVIYTYPQNYENAGVISEKKPTIEEMRKLTEEAVETCVTSRQLAKTEADDIAEETTRSHIGELDPVTLTPRSAFDGKKRKLDVIIEPPRVRKFTLCDECVCRWINDNPSTWKQTLKDDYDRWWGNSIPAGCTQCPTLECTAVPIYFDNVTGKMFNPQAHKIMSGRLATRENREERDDAAERMYELFSRQSIEQMRRVMKYEGKTVENSLRRCCELQFKVDTKQSQTIMMGGTNGEEDWNNKEISSSNARRSNDVTMGKNHPINATTPRIRGQMGRSMDYVGLYRRTES